MAGLNFIIPRPDLKNNQKTLMRGFGVPLVTRALLTAQQAQEADPKEYASILGTPIYDSLLILKPGSENTQEYLQYEFDPQTRSYNEINMGEKLSAEENGGVLIEGCIMDVTQQKNIVSTNIIDFNGTVKEFVNNGDYQISLRGFLSSDAPDKYPTESVKLLQSYLMAPISLSIVSKYLNDIFKIDHVIVTNFNFFQNQGLRNVQYFTVDMLSDFNFQIVSTSTDV